MRAQPRFDLNWILVVALTVFAIAPLAYPGFFEANSGFLPVFNVTHLGDAPHWSRLVVPMQGEGKLPYLLAWPFYQWTGSAIVAIKWAYGLAFLLGALGIYAWTRHWLGVKGGVLAAVVYTYLPWHLSAVYVRGAYAEAWLWAFWPPILWAIDRLNERRPRATLLAIGLGLPLLAATFWTQPGLAALALPLFAAYGTTLSARRSRPLLRLAGVILLSFLLLWMAGRWLPEARSSFAGGFLQPFQLLSAGWENGPSFQLGLAAVGLTIVAVALWASNRAGQSQAKEGNEGGQNHLALPSAGRPLLDRAIGFWLGALVALVLLTLPLSAGFWHIAGLDRFVSDPWQVLVLTGFPLTFLAGAVARLDERLASLPGWAALVALVVLASYAYLAPRFTQVDPGPAPIALIQPLEADSPQILLLGYETKPPTEITPTLTLTLTWQAVEPVQGDYTVFVHVLTEEDTKVAQRDARPCDGKCPTNTWQPGAIVVDRQPIALTAAAGGAGLQLPPGPHRLAVGLYLLDSGERAIVVGRDDRTVYLNVQ